MTHTHFIAPLLRALPGGALFMGALQSRCGRALKGIAFLAPVQRT